MLWQVHHSEEHSSAFYHFDPKETASHFRDEFVQHQLPAAGLCEDFFARLSDLFSVTFSHFVYSDYGRCGLKDELLEHPITVQVLPQVSFWGFCEVSDIWNCIFFCI